MKISLCGVLLILCPVCLATPPAAERYLSLDDAARVPFDPRPTMRYHRDVSGALSIADMDSVAFEELPPGPIDFGYTTAKFWLRFGVENHDPNVTTWLLRTFVRFMRPLEVYLVKDGNVEQLLANDETHPFGERPKGIRHLAAGFDLVAGERATVYIRFGAGGTAVLPMVVTTPVQAALEQATALNKTTVFVAVLASLALFNLFHFFAVRALAYLLYGLQATAIAMYVSHMDGFTFQYLWPNTPSWNAIASPTLGSATHFFALLFSIAFLRSRDYTPRYYRWLIGLLTLCAVNIVACFFLSSRVTNQIGLVLVFIITAMIVPHAIYVVRKGHHAARYYLLGWSFMLLGVCVFAARMLAIIPPFELAPLDILRVTVLMEAFALAFGLADQHRRVHLQQAETHLKLVESLEARLEEARERIHLEHENERAMRTLLQRSKQLAATSHDVNQPIQSLKLALNAMASRIEDRDTLRVLTRTLDDMGSVLTGAIEETRADLDRGSGPQAIACGALLTEVGDSLRPEAERGGMEVRVFDSHQILTTSRLPLKRCLMNIANNALVHSQCSAMLLGVRRRANTLAFIVMDDGTGIDPDRRQLLLEPFHHGDDSGGFGLGLSIVREICAEYGWTLEIKSQAGMGSTFSVGVPME